MKEETTPLPRGRGEAVSESPTKPIRTRTNSLYFSPETAGRVSLARVRLPPSVSRPYHRSTRGRSSSSITMMPETG